MAIPRPMCAKVYAETLAEWAKISDGAFAPTDLSEEWAGEEGPVSVSFRLGAECHTLHPQYRRDYLDLDILKAINALIVPSGRQFAYASDVNFAVVLCLTAAERERIVATRALPLAW